MVQVTEQDSNVVTSHFKLPNTAEVGCTDTYPALITYNEPPGFPPGLQ